MILRFRHKGLQRFFTKGDHRGIPAYQAARLDRLLDRLDACSTPSDMNLPGYRWHPLKGPLAGRYAVDVSANWRLTFAWDGEHAIDVDLEDYH